MNRIIFDFDYTLFDTGRFKQNMGLIADACGINQKFFWQTYQQTVEKNLVTYNYDIDYHCYLIKKDYFFDKVRFKREILKLINNSYQFLYSDTLSVLSKLYLEYELVLFTLGNKNFQKSKIEGSQIKEFFKDIIYSELIKQYNFTKVISTNLNYFISDSVIEVEEAVKYDNVVAVLKKHKKNQSVELSKSILRISSLTDFYKVLLQHDGR